MFYFYNGGYANHPQVRSHQDLLIVPGRLWQTYAYAVNGNYLDELISEIEKKRGTWNPIDKIYVDCLTCVSFCPAMDLIQDYKLKDSDIWPVTTN